MFLLILSGSVDAESGAVYFTFQYVSINTTVCRCIENLHRSFTFQYVSINTVITLLVASFVTLLYIPICFY